MSDELIGFWAVNGAGMIGFIQYTQGDRYMGVSVDGMTWASTTPIILSARMQAHFNRVNNV